MKIFKNKFPFFSKKKLKENRDDKKTNNKDNEISIKSIKKILGQNSDISFSDIYVNKNKKLLVTLVYVEGLVNSKIINDDIIKPLGAGRQFLEAEDTREVIDIAVHGGVYIPSQLVKDDMGKVVKHILKGYSALIFEKEKTAVIFDTKGFEERAITSPTEESVIKGARDAFIESIRTNTSIIRRKLSSPSLVIEEMYIGRRTSTSVAVIYDKEIIDLNIVDELKKRLEKIDVDGVVTPGIIEENIIENIYSPFPQVAVSEIPDKFCSNILEGRAGIIIDGFPTSINVPVSINQLLQTPSDYSRSFLIGSLLRLLRYLLVVVSVILPSLYIAIVTFHPEMFPTDLLLSIAASKQGVPLPTFIEVILLVIAFEVLQEAGYRLPKTIGQALSIVGAVIVGEAIVKAKLISPVVVIVVAITAIASFAIPNQDLSNAFRFWRLIFIAFASALGLIGIGACAIIMMYGLANLESFGVPYLSPVVSIKPFEFEDAFVRMPFKTNKERPTSLKTKNMKKNNLE